MCALYDGRVNAPMLHWIRDTTFSSLDLRTLTWIFPPVRGPHTRTGDFRTIGTSLAKTSTEFAQTRLGDGQVIYFFQRSFRTHARDTGGFESYRWDAHSILTLEVLHNLLIGSAIAPNHFVKELVDPCGHGGRGGAQKNTKDGQTRLPSQMEPTAEYDF